jgi:hypothetical protein
VVKKQDSTINSLPNRASGVSRFGTDDGGLENSRDMGAKFQVHRDAIDRPECFEATVLESTRWPLGE